MINTDNVRRVDAKEVRVNQLTDRNLVFVNMNAKLTLVVAVSFVALVGLVPSGDAECCKFEYTFEVERNGFYSKLHRCADCTQVTGYYCAAGSGGCNMFGCNCEGGCRKSKGLTCSKDCCDKRVDRQARDVDNFVPLPLKSNYTGNDVLDYVDANKDGRLDALELDIFVTRHALPADAWRTLDADGDGHLTAHEIDSDLVPMVIV